MHNRLDRLTGMALLATAIAVAACSPSEPKTAEAAPARTAGTVYTVHDTTVQRSFHADGVAEPVQQATLSTKLMGSIVGVYVKEGDAVSAGQVLARIDARDVAAKEAQVSASIADADAARRDAATQAGRIRALYADSAATRAQLDAVETGLARADAGVRAAHAAAAEVAAMSAYSVVRAPFAGMVTRRFVDPGAFAAPGAPLLTVQDGSRLRVTASATPEATRTLRRGAAIGVTIEGVPADARVEGVVPAAAGNLYTINAIVANPRGAILPGSAATLLLPRGAQTVRAVPVRAVTRSGDLTGVTVRTPSGDTMRWVRLGETFGDVVEVTSGLQPGDRVVVPTEAR